jgi:hypothetical protein
MRVEVVKKGKKGRYGFNLVEGNKVIRKSRLSFKTKSEANSIGQNDKRILVHFIRGCPVRSKRSKLPRHLRLGGL